MTDAWLMEADCIHGVAWYDCRECSAGPCPRCNGPTDPEWFCSEGFCPDCCVATDEEYQRAQRYLEGRGD